MSSSSSSALSFPTSPKTFVNRSGLTEYVQLHAAIYRVHTTFFRVEFSSWFMQLSEEDRFRVMSMMYHNESLGLKGKITSEKYLRRIKENGIETEWDICCEMKSFYVYEDQDLTNYRDTHLPAKTNKFQPNQDFTSLDCRF